MGYSFGCLLSILMWNFDREKNIEKLLKYVKKDKNISWIDYFLFSVLFVIGFLVLDIFLGKEIYNFLSAFLVINFSSTEKQNVNICRGKVLDDGIFNISSATVCGFIAPLFYMCIFNNNVVAIIYTLVIIGNNNFGNKVLNNLVKSLNIIPSFIAQLLLLICKISNIKNISHAFNKHYIQNIVINPLLNLDILASYIFNFNFYYYTKIDGNAYIRSYGNKDGKKINENAIKDYQKCAYTCCFIFFLAFILWFMLIMR